MSIFEHQRFEIFSQAQHPYKHNLAEFSYTNPAFGSQVTNLEQTMDWIIAVLYPNMQTAVAEVADLPTVGNTINDMRVVNDDGDGSAASYRWEQREGEVSASWHKIYDMDWGYDSILSGLLISTQDVYVNKYGRNDLDEDGVVLTGDNAGQHIYGGLAAGSNLTLHANSGDGTGAQTGYVQFADNVRPFADSAWTLGTTAERWLKIWTDEITVSTMTITGGQIVDSSGAISFGDENLTTTGSMTAASFSSSGTGVFGTLTVGSASITDSSGAIAFGDENLSTTGSVTGASLITGTLTAAGGSITDSSGAISFGDENLSTTGSATAGQVNADNLRLDGNTLSVTALDGSLTISANGTGVVDITSAMTTIGQTVTGTVSITGQLDADNLTLNGNTISSTDINGNITLDPNGTGLVELSAGVFPTTDSSFDIGKTGNVWNKLWLDGSIGDGTNEITVANLLTFRAVGTPNSGDSLFWDGAKWVASAPDTEIDHGTISGLSDDDHTQYALLAGRATGQTITGGTASGDDLTLESTSNVTKGNIFFSSVPAPTADGTTSLGASGNQWDDLYMVGEAFGMRIANYTTAGRPSASAGTPGRIIWDTDLDDLFVDLGGSWRQITSEQYYEEDAVNWDGATSTATYDVSASVNSAKRMIWALKDNSNDYEQIGCEIDFPSDTSVRVTVGIPLAAGTYTLVGR